MVIVAAVVVVVMVVVVVTGWPQMGPGMAPRWAQDGPRWAQTGSKIGEYAIKMGKLMPERAESKNDQTLKENLCFCNARGS